MIKLTVTYKDWNIDIYYSVNEDDLKCICKALEDINCTESTIIKSIKDIKDGYLNTGFIHSNLINKQSILVIGEVNNFGLFVNTLSHECYHLISHMKIALLMDEEMCASFFGELSLAIFNNIYLIYNSI